MYVLKTRTFCFYLRLSRVM